jgi:hypothetical protein
LLDLLDLVDLSNCREAKSEPRLAEKTFYQIILFLLMHRGQNIYSHKR